MASDLASPLDELLRKKLLLITGKGGIGKTVVAATLGQLSTLRRPTLIVESAATAQIAPLFGAPSTLKHEEYSVPAPFAPGLSLVNLDPPENFREYVVKYLGQKLLYDKVFSHRVVKSFINTIPGFAELMMLGRLFYTCELAASPRHATVVFDGYASGHFLSLMTTPDAVLASNLGGPVAKESARIRDFLADEKKCGIVYVATPEELVVSEALDFLPKLAEKAPARLAALVINKMPAALPSEVKLDLAAPAAQYLARQRRHADEAMASLARGLERLEREQGLRVPLAVLPDLGALEEPFAPGFALSFWDQARWFAAGETP